jgi:hypothetical protein
MGVSRNDVNISGISKDNPFARYANSVAMRESELRTNAANALNMDSSLQDIGQRVGGTINAADIPSVAGLANTQANVSASSNLRATNSANVVKSLPAYVDSYRNYLRWRYPSRYGNKKTSSNSNYTTDFQQAGGDIADISDPYAPPEYKP